MRSLMLVTVVLAVSAAGLALGTSGCKKPAPVTPQTVTVTATATAAPSDNTNYVPGGGAAQNIRKAALRAITLSEMSNLGLMIEFEYTTNGKMPDLNTITGILEREVPLVARSVKDGKIKLCWTTEHAGLWAYEVDSDTKGGIVVVTGSARRAEADEVRKLLGR